MDGKQFSKQHVGQVSRQSFWLGLVPGVLPVALIALLITCWPATAQESYKDTQAYKDYLLLPESYRSPKMEAQFKYEFDAQNAVRNLPCIFGGTIAVCLESVATKPGIDDLGWTSRGGIGNFHVERTFVTKDAKAITYRWQVDANGTARAENKAAKNITKH
ncbi:MAG: hypothetical protein R3E50_01670 [Halioglobus sp.]